MNKEIFYGLMIPFAGTILGSGCVFFLKKRLSESLQKALSGFAAGVMVAASVWSLIIPSIEQSSKLGKLSFVPAFIGFWVGVVFLQLLDHIIPHFHMSDNKYEGPRCKLGKTAMIVLAVTLHNIPEGMAVGIVYAALKSGNALISSSSALALSLGIAIQNFPEGAIISLPLAAQGNSSKKAFLLGALSGIVEPIGALLMIFASAFFEPFMPYLLSFAAGAMMYVVVEELVPEMSSGKHSHLSVLMFTFGFTLMMALDVALG